MGNDGGTGTSAPPLYCDVGLGLKMQNSNTTTKPSSYYPPNSTKKMISPCHHSTNSNESNNNSFMGGGGSSDYGGYGSYSSSGCGSQLGIFDAAVPPAPVPAVLQRTLLQPSGGGMAAAASASGGKVLFTATQWRELERQTTIYKYMMASIPVPPQLLLNFSSSSTTNPFSQSNTGGMDLRFSSRSDPEPWRCRRTDGKKWRCSRDVTPDQKYCERHAHKSRPRSRKHVEIHSSTTANAANENPRSNYTQNPSILSAYNTNQSVQSLQKLSSQFTNICAATYDQQPRSTEWFMKSGSIPVSTSTQQFQQLMQSSPGLGSKRDKNVSAFQQMYEDEPPMTYNPYLGHCTSDTTGSTATRHLFDAWSRGGEESEELNGIGNNYKCSLTLSMQSGGNGIDEDNENYSMGSHVGMMDSDRVGAGEVLKSHNQWLNPVAWMGSAPGGPLGEALCLGIASSAKGGSNVPSPHGYSNSTTTSSSCEDGVHGLNFIR